MEASLRVLRAMVTEEQIDVSEILDYIAYLTKIATFAQAFRWESVLRYDTEYRKRQADMGYKWGADSPYLMQLYLQASVGQFNDKLRPSAPRRTANRWDNKHDPSTGSTICFKFNSQKGCQLKGCRFAHVCISCFQAHPDCKAGKDNGYKV